MVSVEQWAEIRRMHRVERRSMREIHRLTGLHRETIRRALADERPPRYRPRPKAPSKLDPHREQIAHLLRTVERITNTRIRELIEEAGYRGSKTILDDYLRELRPIVCPKRDPQGALSMLPLDPLRTPRTIGRREEMDLPISWDDEVSGLHAEVLYVQGEWMIIDDGLSTNGTYVNGERTNGRRRLRHGDRIRVGRTVLAYDAAGADELPAPSLRCWP